MASAHRPDSTLSDQSVGSSSGAGTSTGSLSRRPGTSQRPLAHPGGPRKPSAKASLPSSPTPTPTSHPQQEQQQQRRQSQNDQPPSYFQSQSQHESQGPSQPYTPPPTSAVTSDSSCSHPPTSVFTRADTPSSMSALSPARATMSPQPMLEPLEETSVPAPYARASLPRTPTILHDAHAQPSRSSAPTIPSVSSKPPTPTPPDTQPSNNRSLHPTKPRMITTLPMPTPLQPPPSVDFSPVSVPFKALTLDAAQWTFSSAELQAIVSRAIRASAEPSSIRLLPLQTLDEELVQELERLESERAQATAQYRFAMHRRTMLLQSLNASASPSSASTSTPNTINLNLSSAPTLSPAGDIAQRLAEVSATLDRFAATLVRVSDQIAQIRSLQDVHAASALAVALRKLNASYARRTREVQSLKEKLAATEDERDEAWRVAEELAMEFDGEGEGYDDDVIEGSVVNGERAVAVPATLTRASRLGVKIKMTGVGPRVRQPESEADVGRENEDDNGRTGNGNDPSEAEANPNSHADSPSSAVGEGVGADTAEVESAKTTPIARRKRANSATSRVTAARTRSLRASKASLRFPRSRKQSSASRPTSTYSQHSTQSGHGGGGGGGGGAGISSRPRSRSRANSTSSAREASPTSTIAHSHVHSIGTGIAIPDVPKIPNATELARLASVKSTASAGSTSAPASATTTTTVLSVPPIPPVPPPKIETSPSKTESGSFLDMTTRPNSATDEKGTSPSPRNASLSSDAMGVVGQSASDIRSKEELLNRSECAQVDGVATRAGYSSLVAINERCRDADTGRAEGDEGQTINVSSRLTSPQLTPFTSSHIKSSSSSSTKLRPGAVRTVKNILATQPSLQVYPPNWTRPPPDSPVDVTRGSGPHRADNGVDDDVVVSDSDDDDNEEVEEEDEEEREIRDAFENAYSKTEMQSTRTRTRMGIGNVRSPMRTQHTQSMLPFPGSSNPSTLVPGPGVKTAPNAIVNLNLNLSVDSYPGITETMRRSPASDNQIPRSGAAGPFLGAAAAASFGIRRPTSLPSAQAERPPWDYF